MTQIDTIALEGSIAQMRTRIAIEQAAMHQVRLSVARWRGDIAVKPEQANRPAMAPSQSAWHAAAQDHFLCWLAKGGFAQASEAAELSSAISAVGQANTAPAAGHGNAGEPALPAACCHNCTA